jgi:hypothetical protein
VAGRDAAPVRWCDDCQRHRCWSKSRQLNAKRQRLGRRCRCDRNPAHPSDQERTSMSISYHPFPLIATPRHRSRGLGTRHGLPAWALAVRALRAATQNARYAACSPLLSSDELAETIIDEIGNLGPREIAVLAVVFGDLRRRWSACRRRDLRRLRPASRVAFPRHRFEIARSNRAVWLVEFSVNRPRSIPSV